MHSKSALQANSCAFFMYGVVFSRTFSRALAKTGNETIQTQIYRALPLYGVANSLVWLGQMANPLLFGCI